MKGTDTKIKKGICHPIPEHLKVLLLSDEQFLKKWNQLTDIARNEWICWITIPKKEQTQQERLKRLYKDILNNKKRPCCWPGCPHRNPNSSKWFNY